MKMNLIILTELRKCKYKYYHTQNKVMYMFVDIKAIKGKNKYKPIWIDKKGQYEYQYS